MRFLRGSERAPAGRYTRLRGHIEMRRRSTCLYSAPPTHFRLVAMTICRISPGRIVPLPPPGQVEP
ncbi:MAG: hypothetical protein GF311_27960 [Candidatus Lokiarchaeota archaeon]|nr:hypothetical protein [Candidatus Lokiarchaeota archaeon]